MVQVDVFWSYGIGAGFALAAARQLRQPPQPELPRPAGLLDDRYLTAALLYLGVLFAPSGSWLLWGFPSWETMHAADRSLPAWVVAGFAATNITQGVLGYLITRRLLRAGRLRLAYLQLVAAYFGMFFILVHGWDGTGYRRFFSATRADAQGWPAGEPLAAVGSWLGSDVALTLYGMGVVLVPVLLAVSARWHLAGLRATGRPGGQARTASTRAAATFVLLTLGSIFGLALGGAIVASVCIHLLGWPLGITGFGALVAAGALVLGRRDGPLSRIADRFAAVPASPPPGQPLGQGHQAAVGLA